MDAHFLFLLLVNFSGRIPIQKTYKFDASQVHSVATAYGYDLLAEDCETLASRLQPVFLPSDNSILMQVHEFAGIWLTVGGVVGGIASWSYCRRHCWYSFRIGPEGIVGFVVASAGAGIAFGSRISNTNKAQSTFSAVENENQHGC